MKIHHPFYPAFVLLVFSVVAFSAEQKAGLSENAALRYWSAFAQMQDASVSDEQAKVLTAVLDGNAAYDDSKYKKLVERNQPALGTMIRGTALRDCDWGLDYQLGANTPVEYVRKALTLGRLNVLYAYHLVQVGEKDRAVPTLAAGLRFSRDTANGGTLFATLVAKTLLIQHLRAVEFVLRMPGLSSGLRAELRRTVVQLGDGLDWQVAMKRELELLNRMSAESPAALTRIIPAYISALNNAAELPALQKMISSAPAPLPGVIPNPKRVIEEKQALTEKLRQIRLQSK
jgi:hypothetical protein